MGARQGHGRVPGAERGTNTFRGVRKGVRGKKGIQKTWEEAGSGDQEVS